jgi:ubiquinone/menaquinone biosynthesis C-methylase UbiE
MSIPVDLNPGQLEQLRERAKRLGIQPEELARAAVSDLLNVPDAEFESAMEFVLTKNAELYRRLA